MKSFNRLTDNEIEKLRRLSYEMNQISIESKSRTVDIESAPEASVESISGTVEIESKKKTADNESKSRTGDIESDPEAPVESFPLQETGIIFQKYIHRLLLGEIISYPTQRKILVKKTNGICVSESTSNESECSRKNKLKPNLFQQTGPYILHPESTCRTLLVYASPGVGKSCFIWNVIGTFLNYKGSAILPQKFIIVLKDAHAIPQMMHDACRCYGINGDIKQILKKNHIKILYYTKLAGKIQSRDIDLDDSLIICDEAHLLVDPTQTQVAAQYAYHSRKISSDLIPALENANLWGLVFLTGTPQGNGYEDYINLHNLLMGNRLQKQKISINWFKDCFMREEAFTAEQNDLLNVCVGKERDRLPLLRSFLKPDIDMSDIAELEDKLSNYILYYSNEFDQQYFPQIKEYIVPIPSNPAEVLDHPNSSEIDFETYINQAFYAKDRVKRLITTSINQFAAVPWRGKLRNKDEIYKWSPTMVAVIQNLKTRQGKAVIVIRQGGVKGDLFVEAALRIMAHEWLDPLLNIDDYLFIAPQGSTADDKEEFREMKKQFEECEGVGISSPILILGPRYLTGTSVMGGVRQNHIITVFSSETDYQQASRRSIRYCSHGHLPSDMQTIENYQYIIRMASQSYPYKNRKTNSISCDNFLLEYRHEQATILTFLLQKVINQSILPHIYWKPN